MKSAIELFAAIVTIVGIAFAVWQYGQIEKDGRITAALGYVARFNSAPIITAFREEYDKWLTPAGQDIVYGRGDPRDLTKRQVDFITSNKLEWNAILLGDFFDQTYVCVREKICDLSLIITMLGRDIEAVYVGNGRYLQTMRKSGHAYTGCGLDALYRLAHARLQYSRMSEQERRTTTPAKMKVERHACPTI